MSVYIRGPCVFAPWAAEDSAPGHNEMIHQFGSGLAQWHPTKKRLRKERSYIPT